MWHTDILNIGFEKQLKNFDDPGNFFKGKVTCNLYFSDIALSKNDKKHIYSSKNFEFSSLQ